MTPLVDAGWLAAHLDDPRVVVLDCRFDLADPPAAARRFAEGHIAGAVHADLDRDLSGPRHDGPNGQGRHPLPDAARLGAAMRRLGVRGDATVVAYDEEMTGGAARAWWLLRHFGHPAPRVLAGGLAAWDGPLSTGEAARPAGDWTPAAPRDDLASHADLLRDDPARLVVDVRAAERYRGEVEPWDPVAGHVPGAVNRPFPTLLPAPADLVAHPGPVVAYCGSGVTACVALLGLAAAGRDDALLYAGSWSDWSTRGLPAASGG